MAVIALKGVTKSYVMGETVVRALDGVTFAVEPGEFVAIVGRSGSGKTTLLNLMGGLDRPTSGDVLAEGVPLGDLSDDRLAAYRLNKVGFVFQFFNLMAGRTALENVELPMIIGGRPRGERTARARELLDRVGLAGRSTHRPQELSGGEQQRVAIARALAYDPPLILADEPTGNLDSKTAREVLDLIGNLNREQKKTVIMVTHDAAIAGDRVDRRVEMGDGKVSRDEKA
ncbi:MAG: ABC transporter ATP-binding protein [Planctomycetota bacterium]|jgi:putative ABC transport system ATP-binding protein